MLLFADEMTGAEIALIITASFGGVATLITAVASSIAAVYLVKVKLLAEQTAEKLATNNNMTQAIAVQQVQMKKAVGDVAANQVKTHEAVAGVAAALSEQAEAEPSIESPDGTPIVKAPVIVVR